MSPAQITRVRRYREATQSKRVGSMGVSAFLHISLAVLVIVMSTTPIRQYNLDTPMLSLRELTIGASGPQPEKTPAVGHDASPPPQVAESDAVQVPKIDELEKQPAPVDETPKPSDDDLLAAALAGAKAEAKVEPKISGGQSLLDEALKSAGSAAKTEKIITGESGSGVGVIALYEEVVAMQIRRNFFTRPYADGRVYEVVVLVEIADNGNLLRASVVVPSGDPTLDANVLRAIREVGVFEPPPGNKAQKLEIPFSSDIYAGQ